MPSTPSSSACLRPGASDMPSTDQQEPRSLASQPTPAPTHPPLYALGFSRRKQALLRSFLGGQPVRFVTCEGDVPEAAELVVWGAAELATPARPGSVLRVEDGFLRSVGLGAAFARPSSWIVDRCGIHYDASRPSELEHLLQETECSADLLARAATLRQRIVAAGATKYNLGGTPWRRARAATRVCLAVGQVESDASLRLGSPFVRSDAELVARVRKANPGAYIVYKPHPDVCAGLREPGRADRHLRQHCDEVVEMTDISTLFDAVDEVHVMTSLAGFEALLRGRRVVTHGQPFYAGWGLTVDAFPPARRARQLTLDTLVACTLILYPRYVDALGVLTTPETVLDELMARRAQDTLSARSASVAGRLVGQLLRALVWTREPSRR